MKKSGLCWLLVSVILISLLVPGAWASEEESNYIYFTVEGGQMRFAKHGTYVTLLDYDSNIVHLDIPAYVEGLPVKEIYFERGIKSSALFTDITIPETVNNIDSPMFSAYPNLTRIEVSEQNKKYSSVDGVLFNKTGTALISYPGGRTGQYTVPEGVTEIGKHAFSRCSNLTGITLPETLIEIKNDAFEKCESLTAVTLPDSLKTLGAGAFYNCTGLKEITIPESVTEIKKASFQNCSGLERISLSDNTTQIGDFAFSGCSSLKSATIPKSVTFIGKNPFMECVSLTMEVENGNNSYTCSDGALFGQYSVAAKGEVIKKTGMISYPTAQGSYTVPDNVASVGAYAFSGCKDLVSVTLGKDVTSVARDSFSNCIGLKEIIIPVGFNGVGQGAFLNCGALSDVYFEGSKMEWEAVSIGIGNTSLQNAVIHYGSEDAEHETASVTNVTITNDGISADIWCGLDSASAFCICYDERGQMAGTDSCVLTNGENNSEFSVDVPFSKAIVVVLDSQYKPLCSGA